MGAASARNVEVEAENGNRDELLRLVRDAEPGQAFVLTTASSVADVATVLDALATSAIDPNARPACRRAFNGLYNSPAGAKPRDDDWLVLKARRLMAAKNISAKVAAREVARSSVAPEDARAAARRLTVKLHKRHRTFESLADVGAGAA